MTPSTPLRRPPPPDLNVLCLAPPITHSPSDSRVNLARVDERLGARAMPRTLVRYGLVFPNGSPNGYWATEVVLAPVDVNVAMHDADNRPWPFLRKPITQAN